MPASLTTGYASSETDPKPGIPPMSEQQWDRIYRKVDRIEQPGHRWENAGYTAVGLLIASAFGLVAWWRGIQGATAQSVSDGQWEAWVYVICVIASLLVMGSAYFHQKDRTNQLERDKSDALEEMRDFHMPVSLKGKEPE